MIRIIWPEERWVSIEQILSWHRDAVANNEVDGDADERDVRVAALALEDAGLITLSGGQFA